MKPRKSLLKLSLTFFLFQLLNAQTNSPYLSNLSATKDSPLYTTYAAAMERSEFTLDEGYHLLFYDPDRGADFATDTGGDLCLAFKRGREYIYELKNVFREPIITVSYPDMVKYYYFPFPDLRVDVTFLVFSSHLALQDVILKNTGNRPYQVQVIPFLQNHYRTFNNVKFHREKNAISFTHQELPDGWVLSHHIPYVDNVQDVLLLSRKPERMTSFRSYRWGHVEIPHQIDIKKKARYIVWGRIIHSNGERCRHSDPAPVFMVMLNNDSRRILTETAPRWGSSDPNVSPYGYYGIELGNFGDLNKGDVYTIHLWCPQTGESAIITDTIKILKEGEAERKDLILAKHHFPEPPTSIDRNIWGSGTEMRLFWEHGQQEVTFNVYRRDYRREGVFRLMARRIPRKFYTDKNIQGDKIYGYVVVTVDSQDQTSMHSREINNIAGSDFLTDIRYPNQIKNDIRDLVRVIAMPTQIELAPGAHEQLRIIRGVSRPGKSVDSLITEARKMLGENLNQYRLANEKLFLNTPELSVDDSDTEMLYWSAFNLMRQVMLPPEGKCSYNYYVFSREPTWGWGHGGQVFHESLTMLAYAYLDPQGAMNSQRLYRERQHPDGYINYRTGPYLDETIPYQGQMTTSAPWYAWENWMIYQITRDRSFLKDMYASSKAFYQYYLSHRDADDDGLCEWGAHAVLESVRDGRVAVWDEVGWPSNFEALDLNVMLVQEARALAAMASELGLQEEAARWKKDAFTRQQKINESMWDEQSGFYYHLDREDHDFSYKKTNDLMRQEIIGFLPLWAGIASKTQAEKLVQALTDPNKFWRKFGVPSLAADDPYYNPRGYWNGPVWVEWDYLILHGLLQYGYADLARELVSRVAVNMIAQLKKDHQFWEFYSPDDQWAGYHKQYIWAGIINRMLIDVYGLK